MVSEKSSQPDGPENFSGSSLVVPGISWYGCFLEWGIPKIMGFNTKMVLVWNIWGTPHFWKPPYRLMWWDSDLILTSGSIYMAFHWEHVESYPFPPINHNLGRFLTDHFSRFFHYKPSILGYPHLRTPPIYLLWTTLEDPWNPLGYPEVTTQHPAPLCLRKFEQPPYYAAGTGMVTGTDSNPNYFRWVNHCDLARYIKIYKDI